MLIDVLFLSSFNPLIAPWFLNVLNPKIEYYFSNVILINACAFTSTMIIRLMEKSTQDTFPPISSKLACLIHALYTYKMSLSLKPSYNYYNYITFSMTTYNISQRFIRFIIYITFYLRTAFSVKKSSNKILHWDCSAVYILRIFLEKNEKKSHTI